MRSSSGLIAGLLVALACASGAAQEVRPPRLAFARVDWAAALATLNEGATPLPAVLGKRGRQGSRRTPPPLWRLNNVMSQHFAGLAQSPVPVLLPFDVD